MATLVYLEDGKMDIRGKGAGFNDASYKGSAFVKEWQEVMVLTDPFNGDGLRFAQLEKQYHEAVAIGDEDAMKVASDEASAVEKRTKEKLKNWVTAHPNSGVCGYILTNYFANDKNFIDSVYETLGDRAGASRIFQRYKFPGKVDQIPLELKVGEGEAVAAAGRVKPGTAAPDFTIPDLAGKNVTLSGFKGKYVFIDFWASWCSPVSNKFPISRRSMNNSRKKLPVGGCVPRFQTRRLGEGGKET